MTPPGTWRLLTAALCAWGFAAVLIAYPGWARSVLITAAALGALLLLSVAASRGVRWVDVTSRCLLLPIAFLVLVTAQISHQEWVNNAPELQALASASPNTVQRAHELVEAEVDGFVQHTATGDVWVNARVVASRGRVPVTLWLPQAMLGQLEGDECLPPERWVPGTRLRVSGGFRDAEAARSSAYTVNVREIETVEAPEPWHRVIASLRLTIVERSAQVEGARLVPGFTVGDTTLVTQELDEAMKTTSLTHLIAVSGANCALVVAAAMTVAAYLGVGRRARILLGAAALWGFTLIVGPDPSIQRAALMAGVTLISRFGGRRGVGFASLGCAVLFLLVSDPWQARHPGFTLSVAATAGIMLWSKPLTHWLTHRAKLPTALALTLSVTVAAQIACGPLLLLLQPGLALGGIFANMLAAPAAPLGTGLGLLAMLAPPMLPFLGECLTILASIPSAWVAWLAFTIAEIPLTRLFWPGGPQGALLLTVCQTSLITSVWLFSKRPRGRWNAHVAPPLLLRRLWWVFGATGIGLFVAVSVTSPVVTRVTTPNNWFVVMCDVGQGDAFLIRNPAAPERVMLIDTGVDPQALSACLDRFTVREITLLVLTHDDADHIGGVSAVLERTRAALISRPVAGDEGPRKLEEQLQRNAIPYRVGVEGMGATLGEEEPGAALEWHILGPTAEQPITSDNAASIVMRIEVQGVCLLMLGDTGAADHAMLRSRHPDLSCDVVKVAHHGSKDAEAVLLEQVAATYGLVSSGADNRYGHPSQKSLDDLANARTIALRSDEHGSMALSLQGDRIVVWSER